MESQVSPFCGPVKMEQDEILFIWVSTYCSNSYSQGFESAYRKTWDLKERTGSVTLIHTG